MIPAASRAEPEAGSLRSHRRKQLALHYAAGAGCLMALSFFVRGWGYAFMWPAASLAAVASSYAVFGAAGFCKNVNGRMPPAMLMLLAPYLLGAWINSRLWTRRTVAAAEVKQDVFLGRYPTFGEAGRYRTIIDLAAELPATNGQIDWRCFPMLDLVTPEPRQLHQAAAALEEARANGKVLVCCALGFSRSAAVLATWLLTTGQAKTAGDAIDSVRRAQPRIVIGEPEIQAIEEAARL